MSVVVTLNVHPDRAPILKRPTCEGHRDTRVAQYNDLFGNICSRVVLLPGPTSFSSDFIIHDSGEPDAVLPDANLRRSKIS